MPLQLSFMDEDDIPAFAAVDAAGMAGWGYARAMSPALSGGQPREQMVEEWTRKSFRDDKEQVWLKVADTDSGEMVAAALWSLHFQPQDAKAKLEASAPIAEVKDEIEKKGEPKRQDFLETQERKAKELKAELIGTKPYAYLHILVTHPKYQRRGAGSLLVQWGCEKADEQNALSMLMASAAGLGVYKKHGFEVVRETPLDLRPFGVDETEIRRAMIRQPKSRD